MVEELSKEDINLDYIPEDVLKEVLEEEERIRNKHRRKSNYPSSRDIVEAIIEATKIAHGVHPDEFPDIVLDILKDKGFDVRFVTIRRIWSTYENLVRRGVIRDVLGVLGAREYE